MKKHMLGLTALASVTLVLVAGPALPPKCVPAMNKDGREFPRVMFELMAQCYEHAPYRATTKREFETQKEFEKRKELDALFWEHSMKKFFEESGRGIIWEQEVSVPKYDAEMRYFPIRHKMICGWGTAEYDGLSLGSPPAFEPVGLLDVSVSPIAGVGRSGLSVNLKLRTPVDKAKEIRKKTRRAEDVTLRYKANIIATSDLPQMYEGSANSISAFNHGLLRVELLEVHLLADGQSLFRWPAEKKSTMEGDGYRMIEVLIRPPNDLALYHEETNTLMYWDGKGVPRFFKDHESSFEVVFVRRDRKLWLRADKRGRSYGNPQIGREFYTMEKRTPFEVLERGVQDEEGRMLIKLKTGS